jgi:hypothetical protein
MRRLQLILPAAAVLGLTLMATPTLAAPATSLPSLAPAIADQAGTVQLAKAYARWRCVKKGRCWVPCQGERCRRVCFRSWWACRKSL